MQEDHVRHELSILVHHGQASINLAKVQGAAQHCRASKVAACTRPRARHVAAWYAKLRCQDAAQCAVYGRCSGCAAQCAGSSEPSTYSSLGQGAQHRVLRTADALGTQHSVLRTGNSSKLAGTSANAVRKTSQLQSGSQAQELVPMRRVWKSLLSSAGVILRD